MLSSCFDCFLLENVQKDVRYKCGYYGHEMSYDEARIPNTCRAKKQNDNILELVQNPILESMYHTCIELAVYIERPFTIRELVEYVNYHNKNSLWMLLEQLVMAGRIDKTDVTTENNKGQHYKAHVYYPTQWTSYAN